MSQKFIRRKPDAETPGLSRMQARQNPRKLAQETAAVDVDERTVQETGFIAGEKHNRCRHFLRLPVAPEGSLLAVRNHPFGPGERIMHAGHDHTGHQRIRPHPGSELTRQPPCEDLQAPFYRCLGSASIWSAGLHRGNRWKPYSQDISNRLRRRRWIFQPSGDHR